MKVFLIPWIYFSFHEAEDLAMYAIFFCSKMSASELYITVFCSFSWFFWLFFFSTGHYQEGMVSSFDYYPFLEAAEVYISSAMGGHFDQIARK